MFDRPQVGERALLVHCHFTRHQQDNEDIDEFKALAESAGAFVLETVTTRRESPDAKYFIGSGKADEIQAMVQALDIQLVLVNHALTPSQERNLEKLFKARVCDRTGLILDIFAQRAQTHEGQLQVELAQLSHLATRLVRGWTHLERQKGGIGLRGPGETQLETDRRLLAVRVKNLKARLEKVKQTRALSRKSRKKQGMFTISLVGYTNAGKSTLFNKLSAGEVLAANQLFATLDPTARKITLEGLGNVVLVDTVGFVRHLPHELVESFNATLEETINADLLLHVIDAADPARQEKAEAVFDVLEGIGAEGVPCIEVYNKIDLVDDTAFLTEDDQGRVTRIGLSSVTGDGLSQLGRAIASHMQNEIMEETLIIPPHQGRLRARLHENEAILDETQLEDGSIQVHIRLRKSLWRQISNDV